MVSPKRAYRPIHLRMASLGAAAIAFLAAFEPNLTLRYGPFIALGVFLLANPHRLRIGATEGTLAAFILWSILSQYWTVYPAYFALTLTIVLSLAILFIGIRAAVRWGHISFVVTAYALGCFVGLARSSWMIVQGSEVLHDPVTGRVTQAGDLNVNYVAYGSLAAGLLLVLMFQSRQIRGRGRKLMSVALLVGLVAGILATGNRGAQIALVLLLLWLFVTKFGRPLKTVITAFVVVALSVSFGWVDDWLWRLDFGERAKGGLSGRLEIWPIARDTWARAPIEGVGFGAVREQTAANLPAHNTILEIGTTLGIIGLLLFISFLCFSQIDRLAMLSGYDRRFRLGAIVLVFTPVLLSGTWEFSANAWVAIALLSQPALNQSISARAGADRAGGRERRPGLRVAVERALAAAYTRPKATRLYR